jgi:hypothetical protein
MKNDSCPKLSCNAFRELLLSHSTALVHAAKGLSSIHLSLTDATSQVLAMLQNPPEEAIAGGDITTRLDPQRILLLTVAVSQISGRSIDSLMQPILELHPAVPRDFKCGAVFTMHALDSIDRAITHGEESGNVLMIPELVMEDMALGAAFYAVKWQGRAAGTIALRLGGMANFPQIEVACVVGANNADATIELSALAQSLADSWATARELDSWVAYARECAAWTQLVCHLESTATPRDLTARESYHEP